MALVTSFEPSGKGRQTIHRATRCFYAIVSASNGERYLQLDTVGSEGREIPEKVSQSIQFDRQAAGQLLQILRMAFPDLGGVGDAAESEEECPPVEDADGIEGRTLFKLHRLKERVPHLVRRKKRSILRATGRLQCEVCDFDFHEVYGSLGVGFAECHHRLPLSKLEGEVTTRLADLAIVCPNCHRMLHRCPFHTVEQLRIIVLERRVPVAEVGVDVPQPSNGPGLATGT